MSSHKIIGIISKQKNTTYFLKGKYLKSWAHIKSNNTKSGNFEPKIGSPVKNIKSNLKVLIFF